MATAEKYVFYQYIYLVFFSNLFVWIDFILPSNFYTLTSIEKFIVLVSFLVAVIKYCGLRNFHKQILYQLIVLQDSPSYWGSQTSSNLKQLATLHPKSASKGQVHACYCTLPFIHLCKPESHQEIVSPTVGKSSHLNYYEHCNIPKACLLDYRRYFK